MMEPTQGYVAASEVGRTRPTASHGAMRVVVENYSDRDHPFGKSTIYLSIDSGVTFTPLDWKVSWLSWWKALSRQWPPHDLYIRTIDSEGLHVSYCENTYDGPVDYQASYIFAQKRWRL